MKRRIVEELVAQHRDGVALQLIRDDLELCNVDDAADTRQKRLLAHSLLRTVKKRVSVHLNVLLHSAAHQHILAAMPADAFQELLHFNEHEKTVLSSKDTKEVKAKPNKVLAMNCKLVAAINSLRAQDDNYDKAAKQDIETLLQIISLLMRAK